MPDKPSIILVIDDNKENLRLAVDLLEANGHAVRTAKDGLTGLQRAAAADVQLILLDVQMPGIDGYETCRRLKADPKLDSIPVIFMTARNDVEDKVMGFEVGAVDFVPKPFEARELLARVNAHAQLRALQNQLSIQNQKLEILNQTLEERVADQVAALAKRTEEVERLNAQLREQVKIRSEALGQALRRLAQQTEEDDLSGTLLGERYQVGRRVGVGGMGEVYHGIDEATGHAVAIKVMRANLSSQSSQQRFLLEANSAASVVHPGVVKMLAVDITDDGLLYQVQEFVPGETLHECLHRCGRLTAGVAARVVAELAAALAVCHAADVIHRDLKPSNVILTETAPGLKLVDFGIAKALSWTSAVVPDESDPRGFKTETGAILGTPLFMSPEQRNGDPNIGPASDIYALGVITNLMLTAVEYATTGLTPETIEIEKTTKSSESSQSGSTRSQVPSKSKRHRRRLAHLPISVATPSSDEPDPTERAIIDLIQRCLVQNPADRPDALTLAAEFHRIAREGDAPELDTAVSFDLMS